MKTLLKIIVAAIVAVGMAVGSEVLICEIWNIGYWATPPFGGAFPVHSIVDETTDDLPFCCVYVTDYLGNRYPFETLSDKSQDELFDFAIGEYYGEAECACDWVQDDDDIAWWLSHMEG